MSNSDLDLIQKFDLRFDLKINERMKEFNSLQKPVIISGIKALADYFSVSYRTIQNYMYKKKIPYIRSGNKVFFKLDEVIKSMEIKHEHP